jgi:DNA-binding beta-propeller fold protein YncE
MSASLPHVPEIGAARVQGGVWVWAWALVRVPLLLALAFWARQPLLDLVERFLSIERLTQFAISVLSTPFSRIGVWVGTVLVLWAACRWAGSRFSAWPAYMLTVAAGSALLVALFLWSGTSAWKVALPIACLASNLLPDFSTQARRAWSKLMLCGVGVAEFFFFRRYAAWVGDLRRGADPPVAPRASGRLAHLPGLVIVGALAAFFLGGPRLVDLERAIRMPGNVRILLQEDINGLALDPAGRYLYVTGHGLQKLQRIDTRDASQPLVQTGVSTGGAQGLAYDALAGEVYVFKTQTRTLQYFDAATLALRREVPLPDISPGDPWIAADASTNTLVVASEADERKGSAFVVLDRQGGQVLDRRDVDAGNLLLHPQGALLYLSFFRNSTSLMLYDLRRRAFVAEATTDPRVDRMAFDPVRSELLLASPLKSRVLRFDAQTLAPRGEIGSVFGVRVIAIDPERRWMLTGSLATGEIEVQDLASARVLRRIYLGPWLRTIVLDAASATAYVSANGALYRVPYGPAQ